MDSEVKPRRSLPPLVEGKVHGTLTLAIDEILWTRRDPGDVMIVASWWGEHDSAQFRLNSSVAEGTTRTNQDTVEIYAVKTNATLFEDYIKNCETIELVIVVEKTHEVIGTAHIGELLKIFACKPYSQYVPILSNSGRRIGQIHVSLQLLYLATKFSDMQLKTCKYSKRPGDGDVLLSADYSQYNGEVPTISYKNIKENMKRRDTVRSVKIDTFDTYRSVLKDRRPEFQERKTKFNEMITDELVARIVSRAQRLRGAILKETYNEDSLALSDSSTSNGLYPCASPENEARLYKYILGRKMTSLEEKQALNTLRSTSPTPSLINLASETITTCKYDDMDTRIDERSPAEPSNPADVLCKEKTTYTEPKGTHPLDYVDSIRIFIESFTLNPAGYRRAKSTCLQHGVPLSLTYFVQYNTFGSARQTNVKSNNDEGKFMRTCVKKQVGQVIDFNSESIYSLPRRIVNKDSPLKFKIFVRHLNQKSPTELGCGSMNISEIVNTKNLSNTRRIIIINKGIKMGELKVTIELGCDSIHFGKEFVDSIISAKENIPVLEKNPCEENINSNKYRNVTGTHSSKSSNKVSPVSAKRIECLTSDSNRDLIAAKDITQHREQSLDNKKVDTSNPETDTKDKVLLHGLIYVAEGKDLPESNTYLICRAFWREDKATSQICSNTKNPFYHFCQLIPLIHGTELLERIRDNYIIIEVYSRQNCGTDNLLGIAKLPVHQLYVAYRDPLVLPHLLLSKYPIISVDGWVSINDPISGKSCGELLALVALGTAEQIALLEMSRGLKRNATIISQITGDYNNYIPENTNDATSVQKNLQCDIPEMSSSSRQFTRDNNFAYRAYDMSSPDVIYGNNKTQEVQTDISVLKDGRVLEAQFTEDVVLPGLVGGSVNARASHINKASTDQSAQTEVKQTDGGKKMDREELCLNALNNNGLSDDNDSCSLRNNFQLPTEMYRSVGVGAEYDEDSNQQNSAYNNLSNSSITEENVEKDESTSCDNPYFRAVVEIECALHLPKIERLNESVEPSTYVTFQDLTFKSDTNGQLNSYMITNVFPYSCDPKWNWRCDAKLPTELLLNNEKRLILKVWYLIDPDTTTIINLEKDAVIGFSAVDLSVLMAGFPTVSGWFHIMDFTGKCNGQIKISVTPLGSLPSFEKFVSTGTNNLPDCGNLPHTNWPYLYSTAYNNTESSNTSQTLSYVDHKQDKHVQDDNNKQDETICVTNADHNLEGVSMSILSLSLKQKLSELNEITRRLQSRLRDVTNAAFDDEFDSDFEANELNVDHEYTDNRNIEIAAPTDTINTSDEMLRIPRQQYKTQNDQNIRNDERQISSVINSDCNLQSQLASSKQGRAANSEITDTGYCSNTRLNHSRHNQYPCTSIHNYSWDSDAEYPVRGTRMHINHLLDKLSLDLPPKPPAETDVPMKRNIIDLFEKLRERRNNSQDKNKNNHGVNTCSVLTQTDNTNEQHTYSDTTSHAVTSVASQVCVGENVLGPNEKSRSRDKISTVIREELVAEENDDTVEWDDLTTYLITTNIRYRNVDDIVNPLLYQHLVPDLQIASTISPEGEAIEQLDSRYARNFNTALNGDRTDRPADGNPPEIDVQPKSRTNVLESEESTELIRSTPSGVSGNISGNIDVTVIHKSSNDDLTSGNSTESAIATSFEKLSIQQTDVETENYRFAVSELSVPGVSRQAPDGGNPVEEVKMAIATKRQDNDTVQDVSTAS